MTEPLARLLSCYPAEARPIAAPTPLGNAGGGSGARLWRFESGLGPLVVRAWPTDGPGPSALSAIHAWLARLAPLEFIPVPISGLDGRTWRPLDGRLWELAPWLPGVMDSSRPPRPDRRDAAFAGLAAVHQLLGSDAVVAPSPGLVARRAEAEGLVATGLSRFHDIVARAGPTPGREPALRWIATARDGLPGVVARLRREAGVRMPIQPVLRDARPEHFLFEGDALTGLVDFGAMGVDSPAADLARLLGEWMAGDPVARAAALDAYAAVRPLPPEEVARIDVFAESAAWLGPARWVRWHYVEGRRFDDPDAVSRGLARGLERLSEYLGRAIRS